MENGRIVEQGSSAELLQANGAYRRLYEAQFAQAVADVDDAVPAGPGGPGGVPATPRS
jgi:ATP-binding cassette, subfamily B, multidrug efflux pump